MNFPWSEGRDPVEIHSRLLGVFQEDVYMLSSLYEWIKAFETGSTSVLDKQLAGPPRLDRIDSKILLRFHENEFHSVRTLPQELAVCLSTVYDRLMNVLGFSLRHAWCILHLLTQELTAERVTTSTEMLRILQKQEPANFARIITGDESWFFLEYLRNRVWRPGEEKTPERVSQQIDTEKHMLTICCSTMGQ
jgi:hypothetical protein